MGRDNFDANLNRLDRLVAADLPPDVIKSFRAWRNRASAAMERRNDILHSSWGQGDTPDDLFRMLRTREAVDGFKSEAVSTDDIEAAAEELQVLILGLIAMAVGLQVLAE